MNSKQIIEKCEHCSMKIWRGSLDEFKAQEYKGIFKHEYLIYTNLKECKLCNKNQIIIIIRDKMYFIQEYSKNNILKENLLNNKIMYLINEGGLGVVFKYKKENIYVFEEYYLDLALQSVIYYGIRFWIETERSYINRDEWISSTNNIMKYKELLIKTEEIKQIFPEWNVMSSER